MGWKEDKKQMRCGGMDRNVKEIKKLRESWGEDEKKREYEALTCL